MLSMMMFLITTVMLMNYDVNGSGSAGSDGSAVRGDGCRLRGVVVASFQSQVGEQQTPSCFFLLCLAFGQEIIGIGTMNHNDDNESVGNLVQVARNHVLPTQFACTLHRMRVSNIVRCIACARYVMHAANASGSTTADLTFQAVCLNQLCFAT